MKTFEDFGVALGNTPQQYDTGDAVELAVATYTNLGLVADESKAREAFSKAVDDIETCEIETRLFVGAVDQRYDVVMVPKLGQLTFGSLIGRYNELTASKGNPRTEPRAPLRDKYSDEELNQGQTEAIEAQAVLLGGENDYDEPGLYFTEQTLKEQRMSLKEAQKAHEGDTTKLDSLSVAGYMIRNAMQLERGEQLMDRPTFTRFIGLDNKRVGGDSCVPIADSDGGGQVSLRGSHEIAFPHVGVRLAVGLK